MTLPEDDTRCFPASGMAQTAILKLAMLLMLAQSLVYAQ